MGLSRINSQSITDGSIATTDLADSAVTSAKIGVDVIAAEDLANNSITTAEITDGAVTQAKLASEYFSWWLFLEQRWYCINKCVRQRQDVSCKRKHDNR